MNGAARVAAFGLALAGVFGAAAAAGQLLGPEDAPAAQDSHSAGGHAGEPAPDASTSGSPQEEGKVTTAAAAGLAVAQDGYRLALDRAVAPAGRRVPVSFVVRDRAGRPVTGYDVSHEKRLHLIAVRRDATGFQHVHPVLDEDGTWSAELDLAPGSWKVFADFTPTGGAATTLAADLAVPGDFRPVTLPAERRTAQVDGYTVSVDGDLAPGTHSDLRLTVRRDGAPVDDLEPYLGAYGHLVALREGDLAYLHVHPDGEPGDGHTEPGPEVGFTAEVPSDGTYHLFLDFKHAGVVRTAAFTLPAATGEPETTHDAQPDRAAPHGH